MDAQLVQTSGSVISADPCFRSSQHYLGIYQFGNKPANDNNYKDSMKYVIDIGSDSVKVNLVFKCWKTLERTQKYGFYSIEKDSTGEAKSRRPQLGG